MNIVEICTADSLGGLELYFASCCKQLTKRGHSVTAVVSHGSKLHELLSDEVKCIPLTNTGLIKNLFNLKKELKYINPDIVHVHHKQDLLVGSLLKKLSPGFRYIHTRQMDLPRKKKNPYHSFIYRSMDLIIAITDKLKDQIIERINVDPARVIRLYYGVPSVEPNAKRCKEIDIESQSFNIGVIARIDRKKEQHILIKALEKIDPSSNVKAYLIGGSTDDEYKEELKSMISKLGLEERVHLRGFVDKPQEIMSCFDLMVLTTGNETFGLVLPEAMRMGVAVVGANGGGVPEIIDHGENGLLFHPQDEDSLARQITEMLDPSLRKKLAENGKEKADREFELESHFEKLELLFAGN